jgi:hypothetical protein
MSLVYAKKSTSGADLKNRIMDAINHTRNDEEIVMRTAMSTVEREEMCVDKQGHILE